MEQITLGLYESPEGLTFGQPVGTCWTAMQGSFIPSYSGWVVQNPATLFPTGLVETHGNATTAPGFLDVEHCQTSSYLPNSRVVRIKEEPKSSYFDQNFHESKTISGISEKKEELSLESNLRYFSSSCSNSHLFPTLSSFTSTESDDSGYIESMDSDPDESSAEDTKQARRVNQTRDIQRDKLKNGVEYIKRNAVELHALLDLHNDYSKEEYYGFIWNLMQCTRHFFCLLESIAVREIMESTVRISSDVLSPSFDHEYMKMADSLAVHVLQLILSYYNEGLISVDETKPQSIPMFYRGEFSLGRERNEKYLVHVTSFHYTTFSSFNSDVTCDVPSCPDNKHGVSECPDAARREDDINLMRVSADRTERSSEFLKVYRWHVKFLQNPDLEEEFYFLCCKARRPFHMEHEYVLQYDAAQYYFGKWISPKMNFKNPEVDEIELTCRHSGRFEILHTFGDFLPNYTLIVGVLVDYLRRKRFRRRIF